MSDGQKFKVLRHVTVDLPGRIHEGAGATVIVRFHPAGISIRQTKRSLLMPIPFITGLHGFRSNLWTLNEEAGEFHGKWRSDSVSYDIIPDSPSGVSGC